MKAASQLSGFRLLKNIVLGILFFLGLLLLLFSLFSGSESFGGGISGVLKNSPNSIPWLLFLALVILSRRKPVLGGLLIALFGLVITYFFNFTGGNFFLSTFIVCLAIIFSGVLLLFTGLAIKNSSEQASS